MKVSLAERQSSRAAIGLALPAVGITIVSNLLVLFPSSGEVWLGYTLVAFFVSILATLDGFPAIWRSDFRFGWKVFLFGMHFFGMAMALIIPLTFLLDARGRSGAD